MQKTNEIAGIDESSQQILKDYIKKYNSSNWHIY